MNPNPASPGITSIVQDAEAHHRWHAVGDGYQPLPGDWVVFNGHVEVVTKYAGGVLSTIGGDSVPNFSVNAHEYPGPLASQGVVGFVNNGALPAVADKVAAGRHRRASGPAGQARRRRAATAAGGQLPPSGSGRPARRRGARHGRRARGRHGRHDRHPRAADHGSPAVARPDGTRGSALQEAQPGARPGAGA